VENGLNEQLDEVLAVLLQKSPPLLAAASLQSG